ncbi:MAG TPA: hypothetical protein VM733_22175 [Thermoanaerobaculia bacterium]|nr:hypothetical protein [Thermoanaerobaculia bacterium]
MKRNVLLTVISLSSNVLLAVHLADDVVRGKSPGGLGNLNAIVAMALFAYASLMLAEGRVGRILIFIESLCAAGMPVIHMMGRGVGGAFAKTPGAFFFILTLFILGVTGILGMVLAVRGNGTMSAVANENPDRRG